MIKFVDLGQCLLNVYHYGFLIVLWYSPIHISIKYKCPFKKSNQLNTNHTLYDVSWKIELVLVQINGRRCHEHSYLLTNIPPHSVWMWGTIQGIFRGILLVPNNTVMGMNNVMKVCGCYLGGFLCSPSPNDQIYVT